MTGNLYTDAPATATEPRTRSNDALGGLALTEAIARALATLRREGAVVAVTIAGRGTIRRVYEDGAWRYR